MLNKVKTIGDSLDTGHTDEERHLLEISLLPKKTSSACPVPVRVNATRLNP
jgi:hypothetical protein